jgi:hypothetical protein
VQNALSNSRKAASAKSRARPQEPRPTGDRLKEKRRTSKPGDLNKTGGRSRKPSERSADLQLATRQDRPASHYEVSYTDEYYHRVRKPLHDSVTRKASRGTTYSVDPHMRKCGRNSYRATAQNLQRASFAHAPS